MSKVIGVIGTRRRDGFRDLQAVEEAFLKVYNDGDVICSGLCKQGGDRFAVIFQKKYNLPYRWFPADWKRHGKIAGFLRNTDIAENCDVLIACVAEDRTGGTEDTIRKYKELHKKDLILV